MPVLDPGSLTFPFTPGTVLFCTCGCQRTYLVLDCVSSPAGYITTALYDGVDSKLGRWKAPEIGTFHRLGPILSLKEVGDLSP